MRCKNCGWENPNGLTNCEKCNAVLTNSNPDHDPTSLNSNNLRSTVAESVVFPENAPKDIPKTCPKCGYPISENSTCCPNCNYEFHITPTKRQVITCKACGAEISLDSKFCPSCGTPTTNESSQPRRIQRPAMGTIIGGPITGPSSSTKFCTLKPIPWEGEEVNYNPITFSGETIILNRANTDSNNNSITSREQAVLTCEDGEWYIENRSDLKTTFIRVNGKIKLTSGDIIILGNREFEFKG